MKIDVKKFEKFREDKKLSKKAVSEKIGVSRWTLYRILKGAKPTGKFIIGLKEAFPEIDIDTLLNSEKNNSKEVK